MPAAGGVEDLERVRDLGEAELGDVDAAEEPGLPVIVFAAKGRRVEVGQGVGRRPGGRGDGAAGAAEGGADAGLGG